MDNGASSYRRFLDGDDSGMVEIIKDYKDGLLFFLYGFVGSMSLSEELMEETFVRLVTKKPHFSGKSSFKTWIYAIARNLAADYLRHKPKLSDKPLSEYADVCDGEADLEREYLREEQKIALRKAMLKINPEYYRVLYLIYFEGMSNSEAAEVMKKSKRQTENLIYRAKLSLRAQLEKEGFVYEEL